MRTGMATAASPSSIHGFNTLRGITVLELSSFPRPRVRGRGAGPAFLPPLSPLGRGAGGEGVWDPPLTPNPSPQRGEGGKSDGCPCLPASSAEAPRACPSPPTPL